MKSLVCIGDSLVEGEGDELSLGGWTGRVARELAPNLGRGTDGWQVYNLGIGGHCIKDIEARLGEVLVRNPDVVVIGCGANDVMGADAQAMVRLGEYQQAWERVLRKVKAIVQHTVVLFGFCARDTGVYESNWRKDFVPVFKAHEEAVMDICRTLDVTFIQLTKDFADKEILLDGLHYNAKGYDVVARLVLDVLKDGGAV